MVRRFLLGASLLLASACASGDKIDRQFDTHVARPAYSQNGPVVLFDEAHHNVHTARKSYRPFSELIESDGYRVERGRGRFTAGALSKASVLIIAAALGNNERNDDPAFEESECDAIRDWVRGGGALLLIVDHYPTGDAAEVLARRIGVQLSKGVVEDSVSYEPTFDSTHIVYSRERGNIGTHPITEGRDASERVSRVLTLTGEAIYAEPPAVAFLPLSPSAVSRPAEPSVEKRGGDVIVSVMYGDGVAVPGWSQGLAMEFGRGRIVVLGEAAMLSARLHRFDGRPIGMNTPGYDNRQLALNIMHWLTRVL